MPGGAAAAQPRPPWLRELVWVVGTALVATGVAIVDLELWKMDPRVPLFPTGGDGAYYLATIKGVVEHGQFWHNPDLGAPFGQELYDFAVFGDTAHYAIVWLLALVIDDPVVVFNAFFLLCFPLIALTAYGVARNLGAAPLAALVAGVLFAFLPYHMIRNQAHLFLTSYYAIPLAVWLVVAVCEGRRLVDRANPRRTLAVVAVCALAGAAASYYAIFALLVLVAIVPIAALARRSWSIARQGAAVTALVAASFALAHAPTAVHALREGPNNALAQRQPAESELFGLKLAYMVIPRNTHRVPAFAHRGQVYYNTTPLRSEGFNAALGLVATFGFALALVVLLATGLANATASRHRTRAAIAGAVALASFMIGTIGGGATLIAYWLTPQVRAWNRLSLVIAFAALLTVALLLTAAGDRMRARSRPAWLVGIVAAAVGVVGILDQTSPADKPDHAASAAAWKIDADFVARMEDRFAAGTKVVQLPYVPYPEGAPVHGVSDYDQLRGYLHSTRLRWSFGAIRGRQTDWLWAHRRLAPEQIATASAAAGFAALYLDRAGYPDGGVAAADALSRLTGPGGSGLSEGGRLQFFDLRPVAARLAARTTTAGRRQLSNALLYPVRLRFGDGFSYQEFTGRTPLRWASTDARLELDNPLPPPGTRSVRLTARLVGGGVSPSRVTVTLPGGARRTLSVDKRGRQVSLPLELAHGDAILRLQTAGPAAPTPPNNPRDLRLAVVGAKIEYAPLERPRLARYVAAATA